MAWVRLDDQFFRNPKVIEAGRDGRDLYLAGLCYCGSGLTDGRISAAALRVVAADAEVPDAAAAAERLVEVGLWERVDGGFVVHDYHDYQPTAEKVKAERAAAADRMRRARSRERTPKDDGGSPEVLPNISRTADEVPLPPPVPVLENETNEQGAGAGGDSEDGTPGTKLRPVPKPEREEAPLPRDWVPDDEALAWAAAKGWPPDWVADQTELFVGYWTGEKPRERKRNWYAAWQRWLNNEAQKRRPTAIRAGANGRASPPAAVDWQDIDAVLGA